jgi:hypothetical protein
MENPELVCPDDDYDYLHENNNNMKRGSDSAKNGRSHNKEQCWLNPMPNEAFAPVSYKHWHDICFNETGPVGKEAKELIVNSYAVHLNNKVTSGQMKASEFRKGSLCDYVMTSFCTLCHK